MKDVEAPFGVGRLCLSLDSFPQVQLAVACFNVTPLNIGSVLGLFVSKTSLLETGWELFFPQLILL